MSQKKLRNQSHINRAVNEMRAAFIKQKQKEHFYATPKNEPEGEQKKLQEKYRSSEIEHHQPKIYARRHPPLACNVLTK